MRLTHMRKTFIQTLQQPAEGTIYTHSVDGFHATYLKGRNVVIVEAVSLDGKLEVKGVLQVAQFNELCESVKLVGDERGREAVFPLFYHAPEAWGMQVVRDDR